MLPELCLNCIASTALVVLAYPATNELIYKPDRVKVRFKPAKGLNKKINK